ncbi:RepA-like replication initiator [Gordonia phage Cashline]|nr:RepA-like replication initiator [Gordonia phage Cashline]
MPRIRTIKPEFFRSPDTAAASPVARLLYIAMWCWADDFGRGEADLKALEGFAFPNDDVHELSGGTSENFRQLLTEVVETFGVVLYITGGRPYYLIPSWQDHQRNERSAKPKYPGPDEGVTCTVDEIGGKRRKFRRDPAELPTTSGPGTGEQRNRGTGEQGIPPAVSEVTHQGGREVVRRGTRASRRIDDLNATSRSAEADRFAAEFNRWAGGGIPVQARIEIAQEVDQLIADGISPHQIAEGVKAWHASDRLYASQIPAFVTKAARSAEPQPKATKATLRAVDTLAATEALIAEFRETA